MANVAFILGGGPRIGHGVAEALSAQGYRVALGRRNADASSLPGIHTVSVDVTKPESVANAFASVEKELGAPSVVVYNGTFTAFGARTNVSRHVDSPLGQRQSVQRAARDV